MTLTSVVKYLDTTTKPGWVTWAVLNASPLLSLCQCTSLPHTTDGGLLRLSETPEKAELQWCVFETNALQDFALRNINHASSPRVTACELTLPNYTKGPRHQEACLSWHILLPRMWNRCALLRMEQVHLPEQPGASTGLVVQTGSSVANWAGRA